jgi:AAHS family 4-hydroxybenzoate transporter-like MFS transporter
MTDTTFINVDDIVDRQKLSRFNYNLVFWSFMIMLLDGWDITAAGVAVPSLIGEWKVQPAQLGPVLSATNFGVLFGAPLFGFIGDRFGRKPAIILAAFVFGVFTLLAASSTSVDQLTLARFLAGFGIAGVMANTIALNAEMAPNRMRATLIIIMFMGNTLGGALPGFLAPSLIPAYGWRMLFLIGGIVPLILALCLAFALPESLKFLSLDNRRRDRTAALACVMQPGLQIGPNDRFETLSGDKSAITAGGLATVPRAIWASLSGLFEGRFAIITPLLWLLFAINLMVFYFVNTWTPAVLGDVVAKAGGSKDSAATALGWFQLSGTIGGLVLTRLVDNFGLRPVLGLIIIAFPFVAGMGYFAGAGWLIPVAAITGFCLLGVQFGLNASSGLLYPTHIRSNGVGWAFGIGRLGAVAGPLLGAFLLARHYSVEQLFVFVAAPLVVSAIACFALIRVRDTSKQP